MARIDHHIDQSCAEQVIPFGAREWGFMDDRKIAWFLAKAWETLQSKANKPKLQNAKSTP
nr:hypothetical protein [Paracoccus aminovorans]